MILESECARNGSIFCCFYYWDSVFCFLFLACNNHDTFSKYHESINIFYLFKMKTAISSVPAIILSVRTSVQNNSVALAYYSEVQNVIFFGNFLNLENVQICVLDWLFRFSCSKDANTANNDCYEYEDVDGCDESQWYHDSFSIW